MALKLVVFDFDDTLITPAGSLVKGAQALLSFLTEKGIDYAIASNRDRKAGLAVIRKTGLSPNSFITEQDVGAKKGSPKFFYQACQNKGCSPAEGIYVGHTAPDMRTAVNAKTIFFNAMWAGNNTDYGIKINHPSDLLTFIDLYLLKDNPWFAHIDATDQFDRPIVVRSLVDQRGAGNPALEIEFKDWLKKRYRSPQFELFATNHLLASLYLSGLVREIDLVTVYPGHTPGSGNKVLNSFLDTAARLFHDRFIPTLLVRHKEAVKSAYARAAGKKVDFSNQTTTMQISQEYAKTISDKSILVIDDFLTEGNSFEWARNALYEAGAGQVITVSFGKYPKPYIVRNKKDGVHWDVFNVSPITDDDFTAESLTVNHSHKALDDFRESYERFLKG